MSTNLTPECLLRFMGALEQAAGRQRQTRWGPRTLDLDLLWYDNLCLLQADLILPHPRYGERRFVVEPWLEIWPDGIVGTTPLANCLPEVTQQPMVRVEGPEWAE
jgi:2-amino-4-hydroxy-6-hydroxymethyldihydropteridine diphosphokinase